MIWTKTEAGRGEIQSRALVRERAQRTLLLLIDGVRSDVMLLSDLAGISAADFMTLQALGLITAAQQPAVLPVPPPMPAVLSAANANANASASGSADTAPLDYAQFTAVLTRLISSELGLRGFVLTLAVEKAATADELQAVAQRALTQIRARKGDAAAAAARQALYGN